MHRFIYSSIPLPYSYLSSLFFPRHFNVNLNIHQIFLHLFLFLPLLPTPFIFSLLHSTFAPLCYAILLSPGLSCAMLFISPGLSCAMLYYTILYYAMLCSALLCYSALSWAPMCCSLLGYAILCYAMLWSGPVQGLKGEYYRDTFLKNLALERVDSLINFTWGMGNILPMARNYISIRYVSSEFSTSSNHFSLLFL